MNKIFGRIPPVGNPICTRTSDEAPTFPGALQTLFLESGTAALAAALTIAQDRCKACSPEVIIPAYCCPDLLSAIICKGMKPVLVDFIPNRPYIDLDQLADALNENTIAVIAVNFLGIPERLGAIRRLIENHATLLIEDSAQWFPESPSAFHLHEGDLVIYSFGKGKPVSLLGGGAISARTKRALPAEGLFSTKACWNTNANTLQTLKQKLVFRLYNAAISPAMYWILDLAPFLSLGETRYKPLDSIGKLGTAPSCFLECNIRKYQARETDSWDLQNNDGETVLKGDARLLHIDCETYQGQRLLRIPILFDRQETKPAFIAVANREGLGVSEMYRASIPDIPGIPALAGLSGQYPNAESFSKRLATLPNHAHVTARHRRRITALPGLQVPA